MEEQEDYMNFPKSECLHVRSHLQDLCHSPQISYLTPCSVLPDAEVHYKTSLWLIERDWRVGKEKGKGLYTLPFFLAGDEF